jgi:hypothetical protein
MFRFSIRDLLWLIVVAAILCAWWLDRERQAAREEAIINWQAPDGRIW